MSAPAACDYVSTILRLHDPRRIDRLELALMSLCGQRHAFLSPVIMLQDFSDADEARVRQVAGRLPWRAETRPPEILNLRGLGNGDHRTKLLNAGLRAATGAYVAFLDFDDYLYPHAYSSLIARIAASGKIAAFGAVAIAEIDPDSPAGACLSKRPFPQNRSKYDFFRENFYPIHSFLMKSEVAKSVVVPDHLCAMEDYYFLLSTLKDHDWDDELTRSAPIAEYVYWADQSNTIAGTFGHGYSGPAWQSAEREIERYKQGVMVTIPMHGLLSVVETARRDKAGERQAHMPDVSTAFLRSFRAILPFVGLWRRVEGGVDEVAWNGSETSFSGSIKMPEREPTPAAGLLFLGRPSRLRPSFRHLATIGFEPLRPDDNSFAFAGSTVLTARQMRKGRHQLVLFVVTGGGRLYRASQASVPLLASTIRLHEAA